MACGYLRLFDSATILHVFNPDYPVFNLVFNFHQRSHFDHIRVNHPSEPKPVPSAIAAMAPRYIEWVRRVPIYRDLLPSQNPRNLATGHFAIPFITLNILYTNRAPSIINWLNTHANQPVRLGVDTEHRPEFKKGQPRPPTALLQLATTGGEVLLLPGFQLNCAEWGQVKPVLERVLTNRDIWKAGVGVLSDVKTLVEDWDLDVGHVGTDCGCVDVGQMVRTLVGWTPPPPRPPGVPKPKKRRAKEGQDGLPAGTPIVIEVDSSDMEIVEESSTEGAAGKTPRNTSLVAVAHSSSVQQSTTSILPTNISEASPKRSFALRTLTANYLHLKMSKKAQMSNWERHPLTEEMIEYAAIDAWAGVAVLNALENEFETKEAFENEVLKQWARPTKGKKRKAPTEESSIGP